MCLKCIVLSQCFALICDLIAKSCNISNPFGILQREEIVCLGDKMLHVPRNATICDLIEIICDLF